MPDAEYQQQYQRQSVASSLPMWTQKNKKAPQHNGLRGFACLTLYLCGQSKTYLWRRGRDSNPRGVISPHTLSRRAT